MRSRVVICAIFLLAACRGEDDERHIRSIKHGYHSMAGSPGTEESLEIEIPNGFVIDSIETAVVIDERGGRHKPKELGLSTSGGSTGKQQKLTLTVALEKQEVLQSIHIDGYVIDIRNSRMRRASPASP